MLLIFLFPCRHVYGIHKNIRIIPSSLVISWSTPAGYIWKCQFRSVNDSIINVVLLPTRVNWAAWLKLWRHCYVSVKHRYGSSAQLHCRPTFVAGHTRSRRQSARRSCTLPDGEDLPWWNAVAAHWPVTVGSAVSNYATDDLLNWLSRTISVFRLSMCNYSTCAIFPNVCVWSRRSKYVNKQMIFTSFRHVFTAQRQ